MADLSCSHTNRKLSSFATKHLQSKSLKIFDHHPPLRRWVPFMARIITSKVRRWVTDTQAHRSSTVTLAAHARRGLIIYDQMNKGRDRTLLLPQNAKSCTDSPHHVCVHERHEYSAFYCLTLQRFWIFWWTARNDLETCPVGGGETNQSWLSIMVHSRQ